MKITPRSPADFQVAGHRSLMRLPTVPGSCGVQPPPHSHAFDILFLKSIPLKFISPTPPPQKKPFKILHFPKTTPPPFVFFHRIGDAISQDLQALEAIWLHHFTRRTTWSEFIEYDTPSQKPSSLGPEGKNNGKWFRESLKGSWVWSNYSDLTRPHPKWWFIPLFQGNLGWWNILIWPDG